MINTITLEPYQYANLNKILGYLVRYKRGNLSFVNSVIDNKLDYTTVISLINYLENDGLIRTNFNDKNRLLMVTLPGEAFYNAGGYEENKKNIEEVNVMLKDRKKFEEALQTQLDKGDELFTREIDNEDDSKKLEKELWEWDTLILN